MLCYIIRKAYKIRIWDPQHLTPHFPGVLYLPGSTAASSIVTLSRRWSILCCSWPARLLNASASDVNSTNMSSACLLRLLSWRIMLLSVWLVTHSSSLGTDLSTSSRLTCVGSIHRCINGMAIYSAEPETGGDNSDQHLNQVRNVIGMAIYSAEPETGR